MYVYIYSQLNQSRLSVLGKELKKFKTILFKSLTCNNFNNFLTIITKIYFVNFCLWESPWHNE